jgi:periplasmic protein TonB
MPGRFTPGATLAALDLQTRHQGAEDGGMSLSASRPSSWPHWRSALFVCGLLCAELAQAQFSFVPTPLAMETITPSAAQTLADYRRDAAQHLYGLFPLKVYRGKVPPLVHAIAITETDIDAEGRILAVRLTREPAAAKDVGPWVMALLRRVGQLPAPSLLGPLTYTEIWLIDKSGRFQVDSLTEGQRQE